MKYYFLIIVCFFLFSCSSKDGSEDADDDSGDSGEEIVYDAIDAEEDETTTDTDDASDILEAMDQDFEPQDLDNDGYDTTQDCDDSNPDIFPGVHRECRSECNIGYEVCGDDATWSPCTASTDCACWSPGTTARSACGLCGSVERFCTTDGTWELRGECLDQGSCIPGFETTLPCGNCGQVDVYCNDSCQWVEEGSCAGEGECYPGTIMGDKTDCEPGEIKGWICNDSCFWDMVHDCSTECIGEPRTGDFKDEVCVTGGPFLYGSDQEIGSVDEHPQRVIILSPYFIDKYPVTNARYKECVDAGVCNQPDWVGGLLTYYTAGYENYPVVGINIFDARTFCSWDSGRVVPEEHHWEKASRGPFPAEPLYPWGDDPPECYGPLECIHDCETDWLTCPVGEHPDGATYYGVEDMMGPGFEWTNAELSHDALPECSVDPNNRTELIWPHSHRRGRRCSYRLIADYQEGQPDIGFRCVRAFVPLDNYPYTICSLVVP